MNFKDTLKRTIRSRKFLVAAILFVFVAFLPILGGSDYIIGDVLTGMMIFALYASSWNLLAYSGQGSLGHAAFLGLGVFASALTATHLGLPPVIGLIVGGLVSAGIGFLIGLTCVRLKAWFLAMVTFGFTIIILAIMSQFDSFFGGMIGFPTPAIFPHPQAVPLYYLTLPIVAVSIGIIYWVMNSKLGLAFKAIRENEPEAKMIGINTTKYKLLAFVISTFFAGLAGGLFAQNSQFVQVFVFEPYYSFLPLIMAVVGGLATIEGPIIGAVVIVSINSFLPLADKYLDFLSPLFPGVTNVGPPLRMVALGLFLIVVVIFLPKGLTNLFQRTYTYLRHWRVTFPQTKKKIISSFHKAVAFLPSKIGKVKKIEGK